MRKLLPILLLIAGIVVFGIGVASAIGNVTSSLSAVGQSWEVPGQASQQLEPGNYVLYERVASGTADNAEPTIDARLVKVIGPDGPVPVACVSCDGTSMSVSLNSDSYVGVAGFDATQPGRYTVIAGGDGQEVVVGPSVLSTAGSAAKGIGVAMAGGLLALIGLIWLVVALVTGKKSDDKPAPASATATPAGWYPDPDDASQLRYWDGNAWTEDRSGK